MRFTLNGQPVELTAEDVQDRLRDVRPEPVQEYAVQVGSAHYPVKQAFEAATGISRRKFTTQVARRKLAALGFEIMAMGRVLPAVVLQEENAEPMMAERSSLMADDSRDERMTEATASGSGSGRIFICYRREDSGYPAGWLFDQLAAHFGADRVFKDVDSIEPGDDFAAVISEAVESCVVLLAVIGNGWLSAADEYGRRLDDPDDFVRLEIEAALVRGMRVIPVLVGGARMPRAEQLPASLGPLARRQAIELSHARFGSDIASLLSTLDRALGSPRARQSPPERTSPTRTRAP